MTIITIICAIITILVLVNTDKSNATLNVGSLIGAIVAKYFGASFFVSFVVIFGIGYIVILLLFTLLAFIVTMKK